MDACNYHIRWMIRRDMESVLSIEKGCFDRPWSETDFTNCLRQRNCIGMIAETDNQITGFMIYELHKNSLYVLNFGVDPKYQRKSCGKAMILKLKGKLCEQRRSSIGLHVRETNLGAQLFFRAMDFRAIRIDKDFYPDVNEDAYFMTHSVLKGPFLPHNRIGVMKFEQSSYPE